MQLLFVHDHKFRKIDNRFYSSGGLDDNALTRYINIADKVSVVARVIEEKNQPTNYAEIKTPNVSISGINQIGFGGLKNEIQKADVMIVRMPSFLGIAALRMAKKYKKPYLIEMVGCAWDALWNHSIKGKILAPFITLINKHEVWHAKYILYVTNEFLQKRYPTKGKSIGCSNVSLEYAADTVLNKRIQKIKASNDVISVGTIAAVDVRYKGQQYVIQALGELKKKGITNFNYYLVGNGRQDYLKNIAKINHVEDQVIFVGGVPHDQIFEWLDKNIDIYVQPSRQEGLPRALIEAMSRGIPSFGAKTAGIPELLDSEFIFSNTKRNIEEIQSILLGFDTETMLDQAKRNFFEAQKYEREVIEKRRNKFFLEFIEGA